MRTKQIKVTRNLEGTVTDVKTKKSKQKPKPINEALFTGATLERDRLLYQEAKEKGDTVTMEYLVKKHKKKS